MLLIVVDTVRADRLDLMGYGRETFPWLREFAAEGATFERALSAAPWTVPSHASMFTGLFPSGHGAHHERTFLDESHTTLAELFNRHGWETIALSSNAWISESTGLGQGFDELEPVYTTWLGPMTSFPYRVARRMGWLTQDHSGHQVTVTWLDWLASRSSRRPFFAFLNYIEPHIPYHQIPRDHLTNFAPEDVTRSEVIEASLAVQAAERAGEVVPGEQADRVRDLYDAAIRYQNDLVAGAVEGLRDRDLLDQTIVVVVSDHGHLLGEHGMFDHNRSLSEYLLSVPLVIRYPKRVPAGLRIAEPVTTVALMPTLAELAGLTPPEGLHVRSFAPLFDGDSESSRSPLFSEQYRDAGEMAASDFEPRSVFDRLDVRYRALEEDGFKLIVDSTGSRWLFQPQIDPSETENLIDRYPEVAEQLESRMALLVESYSFGALDAELSDIPQEIELDPEVEEQLRALGYIG